MPGYSQLKKLSENILKLGNEIKLRAERGEKAIPVPIPDTIEDIDDSQDFVLGMPEKPKPPEPEEPEVPETAENSDSGENAINVDSFFGEDGTPDLSAFISDSDEPEDKKKSKNVGDMGLEDLLKAPPEKAEPEPPPKPKGISGSGYSGFGFDDDGNLEDASAEDAIPDISALMGGPGKNIPKKTTAAAPAGTGIPEIDAILNPQKKEPVNEGSVKTEPLEAAPQKPAPETEEPAAAEISDFGLGGIEIENYSPPETEETASSPESDIDADALFGTDLDTSGISEEPKKETKEPFKSIPPEKDLAVLKPDIFTDKPVTKEKPPYYATTPYGQIPQQPSDTKDKEPVEPEQEAAELQAGFIPDESASDGKPVADTAPAETDSGEETVSSLDDIPSLDDFSFDELLSGAPSENDTHLSADSSEKNETGSSDSAAGENSSAEDALTDGDFNSDDLSAGEIPAGGTPDESPKEDDFSDFDLNSDFSDDTGIDLNADLPDDIGEIPPEVSGTGEPSQEPPAAETESEKDTSSADDFSLPDTDDFSMQDGFGSSGDLSSMEVPPVEISADAVEAPKDDADIFSTDGMDFGSFDMPDTFNAGGDSDSETAGEDGDKNSSLSDTGFSLDDFSIQDTDSQLNKASSDFSLDSAGDDFTIPGFSDGDADPYANADKKDGRLDSVDFSGAVTGDGKQRTSLTEDEYEKFKKNLKEYPLNVRIAVEDMIAKNEFTDEVVFEVIDRILKKVTARQLAGHLEKMLDISLPVPRDFERRSAEEYEAYKSSFSYQLKNRILPALILGILAAMILLCLAYLGHRYIYKPIKAECIYKEGYTLLEHDEYPQSEMKFNEALKYKSKKKWFFRYAQGYRAHKQFERAELFYKSILKRFSHDKQAGLEYADMEVQDLANYELAEQILKRELLDYHINDADGILALGDTYLEWGTERDPSKFEKAYEEYSKLQQLYGGKNPDLYQSRFLRYNIRTDQLRNVLELKEFFYPREKSLSAQDWTELSGYLMDKQYGTLPTDQEFLRDKIEDIRDMMIFAIKAAPEDPVANYNLSRYLVQVGDHTKALNALKNTKTLFGNATNLNRRNIYRQLNNYRLLGEEYLYNREYILAQTTFTEGLNLFETRNRNSNFAGDENIGKMYADMGNLDYFISGDLESARRNYQNSIDNKHDTPSIRYRVGYIDYSNEKYQSALNNFIKASQTNTEDTHLLLALGNTLALKDDNFAAEGYYDMLLDKLDITREKYGIVIPQTDDRAGDMVEMYMKTANNLGVTLFRTARQSGSSSKNAKSLVNFQNSIRYYDALTRDQKSMVRLPGSNLAEINLRYATNPFPSFEPEIYTEIPRILNGEKGLEQ